MRRALVLSGGGAKGSWQVGACQHLIVERGLWFDVIAGVSTGAVNRSEEHTSELQSLAYLVCRLLLEKKKRKSVSYKRISLRSQQGKYPRVRTSDADLDR